MHVGCRMGCGASSPETVTPPPAAKQTATLPLAPVDPPKLPEPTTAPAPTQAKAPEPALPPAAPPKPPEPTPAPAPAPAEAPEPAAAPGAGALALAPASAPAPASVRPAVPSPPVVLNAQPAARAGTLYIIECRGGTDKGADGHRRDTIPIANALIDAGWFCEPVYYSDAEREEVYAKLSAADGFIARVNPGHYEGVTQSMLDDMLRQLSSEGKAAMSHPDAMIKMGAKDALVKIRELSCGLPDTYAYYDVPSFKEQFPKSIATGTTRVLKQIRGSQGEGIWVCSIKPGQEGEVTGSTVLELQEAFDNHKEERTIDDFMTFCEKYIVGENGQLVDQRFLPRIVEGELRVNMIYDTPTEIIHKKPAEGGISATLASGAKYVTYKPDDLRFEDLMTDFKNDLPVIMPALGMENDPLPLIWTADFILGDKVDGKDTFHVGEFNCSCVGITQQLHLTPKVAEAAIRVTLSKKG